VGSARGIRYGIRGNITRGDANGGARSLGKAGVLTSFFGWLDYSEQDQRRVRDAIDLFREKGTLDELGVGAVRDAFADMLFPGTSTIQTRARYFLLIPWIYRKLEDLRFPSSQIAQRARAEEINLIKQLAKAPDTTGVIGIDARDRLRRLPSGIYWQGLRTWGIRLFGGSLQEYHRSLDGYQAAIRNIQRDDDGEPVHGALPRNWHAGLPYRSRDFPWGATLDLTTVDAEYLRERIVTSCPGTLLAVLADREETHEPVAFPWRHPQLGEFPDAIRRQIAHARNFSETMHGSALLYNLMLAEGLGREDWIEMYRRRLDVWSTLLANRGEQLARWDRAEFWSVVDTQGYGASARTRQFIDAWIDLALSVQPLVDDPSARALIHERERTVKRAQARLDNRRSLELWGGASGAAQLDFRWRNAQTHLRDIRSALRQGDAVA